MTYDVKSILLQHGINPSFHRLKIYEYLCATKEHPTVDTIHADMAVAIPTLSKTTVYNTVKALVENGLAAAITIEDNEVRYDADMSGHGHFKCITCGALHDVDLRHLAIGSAMSSGKKVQGHLIMERHIYLKGICRECQK
ncbi:MAG: transcriptional repressor [Spirochaetes bacterium]|nr:transcriptional repressor [Spirochaetota bacterium]